MGINFFLSLKIEIGVSFTRSVNQNHDVIYSNKIE